MKIAIRAAIVAAALCFPSIGAMAWWQSIQQGGTSTPPSTTTFNPADKSASITLSGGNLIATEGTPGGDDQVRSIASHSTGCYYAEFTYTVHGSSGTRNMAFGFASASHSLTNYLGFDTSSVSLFPGTTAQFFFGNNPTSVTGTFTAVTGNVFGMAVDYTASKMWAKNITQGTGWNNDILANQNPAVGSQVGGFSFAGVANAPFFLAVDFEVAADKFTLNAGGSAYAGTPPTGCGNY